MSRARESITRYRFPFKQTKNRGLDLFSPLLGCPLLDHDFANARRASRRSSTSPKLEKEARIQFRKVVCARLLTSKKLHRVI